jgi:hypothetical protein
MTHPIDLHDLMTEAVNRVNPDPPPLTRLNALYRRRHRRHRVVEAVTAALVLIRKRVGGTERSMPATP